MKFEVSIPASLIRDAVGRLIKCVAPSSSLPVLSTINIRPVEGGVSLCATDREAYGEVTIVNKSVKVIAEQGEKKRPSVDRGVCINARTFSDWLALIPGEGLIRLAYDTSPEENPFDKVFVYATNIAEEGYDAADIDFYAISGEEMPLGLVILNTDKVESTHFLTTIGSFKKALKVAGTAAATDDSRPTLQHICMDFKDGAITMAGTDGFRLHVAEVRSAYAVKDGNEKPVRCLFPASAVEKVFNVLKDAAETDQLKIVLQRFDDRDHPTRVIFSSPTSSGTVASVLFDNAFPDYVTVIPTAPPKTEFTCPQAPILQAVRRANVVAVEESHTVLIVTSGGNELVPFSVSIDATSSASGPKSAKNLGAAMGSGVPVKAAVNGKFLVDALSLVETPTFQITTVMEPIKIIEHSEAFDIALIVMPMHFNR